MKKLHFKWTQLAAFLLVVGVSIFATHQAQNAANDAQDTADAVAREVAQRKDQPCTHFEGAYQEEIDFLKRDYKLLTTTGPNAPLPDLQKFILDRIVYEEKQVKSDSDNHGAYVPDYCDEPGAGNPEPDPKVPERPAKVDQLLKQNR